MNDVANQILNVTGGETKIQTVRVEIDNGTAASTQANKFNFETPFNKLIGLALIEKSNGGQSTYRIGLLDGQSRDLIQLVPKQLIQTNENVPQPLKLFPITHSIQGNAQYSINVETEDTLTSKLEFDLCFYLLKEDK